MAIPDCETTREVVRPTSTVRRQAIDLPRFLWTRRTAREIACPDVFGDIPSRNVADR